MLPPPTTRQSSWPCPFAEAISPARPATASGSMPNCPCPIKASPESFSRIRLKRGRVMRADCPADVTSGQAFMAEPPRCQLPYLPALPFGRSIAESGGCSMAGVFLSYDRDDVDRARPLAAALEKAGHEVWWDLHVRGGAQFSKVIEEALKAADAVVVLWSKQSVESAWVKDEATAGRDNGRLIPISLDGTAPPLGFRQFQTIDFSKWKGRGKPEELQMLLAA